MPIGLAVFQQRPRCLVDTRLQSATGRYSSCSISGMHLA
jgi:hypothetical protein